MNTACGALLFSAALAWLTAAPAFSQTASAARLDQGFELSSELDIDLLAAAGETAVATDGVWADASVRLTAEQIRPSGLRWGGALDLSAQSADGRRGFSRSIRTCAACPTLNGAAVAGALTGLSGPAALDAASDRVLVRRAELFVQTGWARVRGGFGETAAALERDAAASAFRLSRVDGAEIDVTGLALVDTRLSLAEGAPALSVQSRRLVGVRASLSYAPDAAPCTEACRPTAPDVVRPDIEHIWSIAASFDRRARSSGVRWRASAGLEAGRAAGAFAPLFDDPWLVSMAIAREHGPLSFEAAWLLGDDAWADSRYQAVSASLAYERGDWLYSLEAGWGRSALVDADGHALQLGASRFVGANGLIGMGFIVGEEDAGTQVRRSSRLVIETGLRF